MGIRATQECLIVEVPSVSVGHLHCTQVCLIIEVPIPVVTLGYPITPPAIAGIGPQDFTLALENVVGENVSPFTFGEQEQLWPGDMFTIEATMPPMLFPQAEQWIAFLNGLFGKYGTFLMGDYNRPTPQGPMSGSPLVNGAVASGSNQLPIRGGTVSIANWGVAGDYIQVTATGGQQRLHKLIQNASTDTSGDATLQIRPAIREALTDGITVVTRNCAGTFRLTENKNPWPIDKNRVYTIKFKAREAGLL